MTADCFPVEEGAAREAAASAIFAIYEEVGLIKRRNIREWCQ